MKDEMVSNKIAEKLLQIKAIKLQPTNPFTWASGMKSPIYCDNRKVLSYPEVRNMVRDFFVEKIQMHYPETDIIAGVATGAIAHGILVAEAMNLPFVYVRSSAKGHGLENLIEGDISQGTKIVVIEDLISTGGSSLRAVRELKNKGLKVLNLMAIFTYEFDKATRNFASEKCDFYTLSNYSSLIQMATELGYISNDQLTLLKNWRQDPENWLNNS